ncbi:energy transducer TonB [Geoalkalibacter sp.]|uniref:energy transducer TonB n=1 Tax=Geoalkalibacter sp. TaxID=3041440 RepID=UPI00272DFD8B|nr:energy transducer TonB [Geoalkalibacter sp.]
MRRLGINQLAFFAALALHGLILAVQVSSEMPGLEAPARINVRLMELPAPTPAPLPEPVRPPPPPVDKVRPLPPPKPEKKPPPPPREPPVQASRPLTAPEPAVAAPSLTSAPPVAPAPAVEEPVPAPPAPVVAPPAPPAPPVAASRLGEYLETVRLAVEAHKQYPSAARQLGQQGSVLVRARILPDGSLAEIEVVASSGHRHLDRAALAAVRNAAPLRAPDGYGLGDVVLEIPITFRLT